MSQSEWLVMNQACRRVHIKGVAGHSIALLKWTNDIIHVFISTLLLRFKKGKYNSWDRDFKLVGLGRLREQMILIFNKRVKDMALGHMRDIL